jgi:hypothetical protein
MNIKWMVLILMILVVGLIAMQLFVPQKVNADGTITTFGKKSADNPEDDSRYVEVVGE